MRRPAAERSPDGGAELAVGRYLARLVAWLVPVAVVWVLVTPVYNRALIRSADLVLAADAGSTTTIVGRDRHRALVTSLAGPLRTTPRSINVTNVHFPIVLLGAMFLAVPGLAPRARLRALVLAVAIFSLFAVVDLFFWVKFFEATQLGDWSLERYGPVARHVYGLGKHLLDLPIKLALPLALWAIFYGERVGLGTRRSQGAAAAREVNAGPSPGPGSDSGR